MKHDFSWWMLAVIACSVGGCSSNGSADASEDGLSATDAARDIAVAIDARDVAANADVPVNSDVPAASDAPIGSDVPMTSDTGDASTTAPTTWVMGYYPGYQRDLYPPDAVDFTSLTHLAVGPVVPHADGTLDTTFDIDATNGPILARDLATRAHAAGRRAILMIGGAGAHAGWVGAASATHRAAFVTNLLAMMHDYHYDGLDLDWEPVDAADQPALQALAQALRTTEPGIVLTIPVGYVNANFPTVDAFYATIAPLFDQMNIMSYGMAGPWSGWDSWHSSALQGESGTTPTSVASSVNAYLAAGVPAARIGIGIGFYGSCWSPPVMAPRAPLNGSTILADDNVMSFTNIMGSYYGTAAYHYDSAADAPYLSFASAHGPQGCTWVSYEDETSVAAKGRYVHDHHLGGAIIWTVNQGHVPTAPAGMRDPLLTAIRAAFLTP